MLSAMTACNTLTPKNVGKKQKIPHIRVGSKYVFVFANTNTNTNIAYLYLKKIQEPYLYLYLYLKNFSKPYLYLYLKKSRKAYLYLYLKNFVFVFEKIARVVFVVTNYLYSYMLCFIDVLPYYYQKKEQKFTK